MCKPWKVNGVGRNGSNYYEYRLKPSERRRVLRGREEEPDLT